MFDYRIFLMTAFKSAVGHMADYQILLNANGYYEKGVLTEDDLAELQEVVVAKNTTTEEVVADEADEVLREPKGR